MCLSRSIVMRAYRSHEAKELLINLIRKMAEETDNEIDDILVDQIELALCFNEKSKLK